jgi:hypothetical protein
MGAHQRLPDQRSRSDPDNGQGRIRSQPGLTSPKLRGELVISLLAHHFDGYASRVNSSSKRSVTNCAQFAAGAVQRGANRPIG